jgi:hypothetical protein
MTRPEWFFNLQLRQRLRRKGYDRTTAKRIVADLARTFPPLKKEAQ